MGNLLIANARVFTAGVPDAEPVDVLIKDGRIAAIGPGVGNGLSHGETRGGAHGETHGGAHGGAHGEAQVLDARGASVTPGLLDAHCHAYGVSLSLDEMEHWPLSLIALKAARRLEAALRRGFTTVRDVGGGDPGLAQAIREGLLRSPRYLYTGPALSQTGGHGDGRDPLLGGTPGCGCCTNVIDGPDRMRVRVRELLWQGAHAIKLLTSGGVVSPADPLAIPQFSPAEIQVAVEEATRRGTYVTAHAYSPAAIKHSVENGVRCIEHGNLLDEETAAMMAAAGASLIPTLAAYDAMDRRGDQVGLTPVGREKNTQVLAAGKEAVKIARAAGVRIGFGTDLMGALEDEQLQGLRLQCEVEGIERTLEAATATNAAIFGLSDVGRVQEGFVADLLVFTGNLREQPELLWEGRRTVIQAGEIVSPCC
ncbi:MAG: amidohydrolase family protein [Propionibacteriaceae bacterium]|jgi:imidazolonepropionase-like amidohydrolase|nr:amidohydrolase family protein [Propionibacteriaceae bacterium]